MARHGKRKNRKDTDSSQSGSSVSDSSFLKDTDKKDVRANSKKPKTVSISQESQSFCYEEDKMAAREEKGENPCESDSKMSDVVFPPDQSPVSLSDVMNKLCKIDREVEKLTHVVDELRGALFEVREENKQLRKEVAEVRGKEETLRQQLTEAKHLAEVADRRTEDLSAYVRRNNMRIYGVVENSTESPQQCEDKVLALFRDKLSLNVSRDDIEAVHRVGQRRRAGSSASSSDAKPRGIVIRFLSRRVRDSVLYARKGLKGTKVVFVEDLTPRAYSLLCNVKSDTSVCAQAWTRNGHVIMKTQSGKIVHVQSISDLRDTDQRAGWVKSLSQPKRKQ